jgi:DNA topoisomerase-1
MTIEELTFDEALGMLAEKAALGPTKRKSAPRKKAATKKAAPKKAAKKKAATKPKGV